MEDLARELALKAHEGKKYGDGPYAYHLLEAVMVVEWILTFPAMRFYSHTVIRAATWLHDAPEDTQLSVSEIARRCGSRVADLVSAVTDVPGINRQARKNVTYPKIRAAGPAAVAVKLADRIANIKHGILKKNTGLLRMYAKEHSEFTTALYSHEDGLDEAWVRIDDLLKQAKALAAEKE